MVAAGSEPRVVFFIDGFNLYHSVKAAESHLPGRQLTRLDQLDLKNRFFRLLTGL